MFTYTENDTESDTRIKNNNVLYKTDHKYKKVFPNNPSFSKNKKTNISNIHIFKKNVQRFMMILMALFTFGIICIF